MRMTTLARDIKMHVLLNVGCEACKDGSILSRTTNARSGRFKVRFWNDVGRSTLNYLDKLW